MQVVVPQRQDRHTLSRGAIGAGAFALAVGVVALVAHGHYSPKVLGTTNFSTKSEPLSVHRVQHEVYVPKKDKEPVTGLASIPILPILPKPQASMTVTALEDAAPACKWTYDGNEGPMNWGKICQGKYPLCGTGTEQSPIDIVMSDIEKTNDGFTSTIGWTIPSGEYANYIKGGNGDLLEEFNGHAFEVSHIGATLQWGPKGEQATYKMKQFHMHTPSEHKVNGVHYDMEMHFVHILDDATDTAGWSWTPKKVIVVAQFFKSGVGMGTPFWVRQLSEAAPKLSGDAANVVPIDFASLAQSVQVGSLPQSGPPNKNFRPNYENFFKYDGSFTTPPCTEGVQWVILKNPIFIEKADLNPILALQGENYRPVQPVGIRKLISNIDKWDGVDITMSHV